ncbi:MAG: hypothetical protein R3F11_06615 [Verrucomicrobiales bacterium]
MAGAKARPFAASGTAQAKPGMASSASRRASSKNRLTSLIRRSPRTGQAIGIHLRQGGVQRAADRREDLGVPMPRRRWAEGGARLKSPR